MKAEIDTIILAAGTSSRMKRWKMLLPFNGKTLIENSVESALKVCTKVILVVGYRGQELIELFGNRKNITIVENKNYIKGMFTSIKNGLKRVESDYFFITHGDLPLIPPEIYQTLYHYRGPKVVVPLSKGKRGHPVLLPKKIIKKILQEDDNCSMKEILSTHPLELVEVNSRAIYMDIDREEDYINLKNTKRNPDFSLNQKN